MIIDVILLSAVMKILLHDPTFFEVSELLPKYEPEWKQAIKPEIIYFYWLNNLPFFYYLLI